VGDKWLRRVVARRAGST